MTATLFCKTSIQTAITPTNIREAVQELTRIDKAALVAVGLKRPITSGQGLAMDEVEGEHSNMLRLIQVFLRLQHLKPVKINRMPIAQLVEELRASHSQKASSLKLLVLQKWKTMLIPKMPARMELTTRRPIEICKRFLQE